VREEGKGEIIKGEGHRQEKRSNIELREEGGVWVVGGG